MIIQIDDREGDRIEYAKKQYKQHDVEKTRLETGDFIFNQKVAFEYKKLPDFIRSVQSGRMVEQAIRLNQQYKYPFVIIEAGDITLQNEINRIFHLRKTIKGNRKPAKFYEKNYYGAINSLNCYVTVLTCPTQYLCFQSMLNQAKKCLNNAPINRKVAKTGNTAYNCLRYCVGGVGPKTAEKLVNECGLKSIEDVLNVSVDDMVAIKGISLGKAEVIYHNIHKQ